MKFNLRKKATSLISAALVGSLLLTACSEKDLAAKVNDENITNKEYQTNLTMRRNFYISQYGEDALKQDIGNGSTLESMVKQETIDGLVFEEVLLQDAEKKNIKTSKEDLKKEVADFKKQVGGEEGYKTFLSENKIEEKYFEELMEKNLMMEVHKKNVTDDMKLKKEEVEEYYEKNKDSLLQVKASHILVESEEQANEISEAIKSGDKFEDHVDKSTEEGAAERKGDLGYFGKGQMVPEFEEAVFAMEENTVSEPVKSDFGYHIIKLTDKKEKLEDVRKDIETTLKEQKYGEYVTKLKEDAKIEILLKEEKETKKAPEKSTEKSDKASSAEQTEAEQTEEVKEQKTEKEQ